MAAYARLQFEDLSDTRRASIESALLRYCELDTLAMVMAIQAWRLPPRETWAAHASVLSFLGPQLLDERLPRR